MSTRMDEIEKSIEEIVKQKAVVVNSTTELKSELDSSVKEISDSKVEKSDSVDSEVTKEQTIENKVEQESEEVEPEVIPQDDYSTHTQRFTQFMKNAYNNQFKAITKYSYDTVQFIAPEWDKTSTSYTKIIKNVLMIAANKLMGAPHNYVSPSDIEDYKMWKNLNKANRTIARIYAQTAGMPFL